MAETMTKARVFRLQWYDSIDYHAAWAIQREWVASMLARGECLPCMNLLLLLEHPSVYTVGRSGQQQDILMTAVAADTEIVSAVKPSMDGMQDSACWQPLAPVVVTDRGGKVTYHGPGQMVAYVVCDLRPHALAAVRRHVTRLEETAIQTLSAVGVAAHRELHNPGVWVGGAKIGALGVRVRRGVAYHGIAINRHPDLHFFRGIVPCGLANRAVTSLAHLGVVVTRSELEAHFLSAFREVFGVQWEAV